MSCIIETKQLTKNFPVIQEWRHFLRPSQNGYLAVDNVDLVIEQGEFFGLVGPNGAGKTTLVKLLSTLIIPSSGTIRIAGYNIRQDRKVKKLIGLATSDERSFYWRLTGRQNLSFFASLHNMNGIDANRRIKEALDMVNLKKVADKRFHTYSTGMRQRLSIARAMLTNPKIIFLDEPSKGLDPPSVASLHKLIREYLITELGVTVFLTSHHLNEVEDLCDRIAVMSNGRIQGCGTMTQLRDMLGPTERYRVEAYGLTTEVINKIKNRNISFSENFAKGTWTFEFSKDPSDKHLTQLVKIIVENHGRIKSISCDPISLSTIFDHLTTKQVKEGYSIDFEPDRPPFEDVVTQQNKERSLANKVKSKLSNIASLLRSKARILLALTKRDMLSETSYRFSFFMQIFEIFLTIVALFFLSKMLGEETVAKHLKPYGGDYFSFAMIGVAFYSYFNIGFSSFANKFKEAQTTGTLEAMLSTPADLTTIVLGSSIWRFIMTTIRVMVFLICGAFMFPSGLAFDNLPSAVLILLLTMVSASSFGIISASFIIVVKKGDPISWLFKSASWILGGVVFPVTVLPNWMQKLSLLLPTVHALKAMRLVLLKGVPFVDVLPQIGALCVFCFVVMPFSLGTLHYAVKRAKKEGTLTHY